MGGTKTQISHPGEGGFQNQKSHLGPLGDSAYLIPHPLWDGGFQNSLIYQAYFVEIINRSDNSPISDFRIGILVLMGRTS